jgi:hypothetical protein
MGMGCPNRNGTAYPGKPELGGATWCVWGPPDRPAEVCRKPQTGNGSNASQDRSRADCSSCSDNRKKPRSVAVMATARRTRSGTSGLGDCWDSADVTLGLRCSGPVIPPTLQSPHMSQELLSLDHLLSCVLATIRQVIAERNKKSLEAGVRSSSRAQRYPMSGDGQGQDQRRR